MNEINLRSLDLNLLVTLDILLDECHITHSAHRLNMSQSAMSHRLSRLRYTFDDELLVRTQSGYEKTEKAKALEPILKEALRHVKSVYENQEFDPETFEGSFTISTLGYGEAVLMPKLMPIISEQAPKLTLSIVHREQASYERNLAKDADLLFGANFGSIKRSYRVQQLFTDKYVCVMHRSHPLANEELTLENYVEYPHSVVHPRATTVSPIDMMLEEMGKQRRIARHGSHFYASILSLKNSQLLQTIPQRLSHRVRHHHELVEKELPFKLKPFGFYQMWHIKNQNNDLHRWLRGKIHECGEQLTQEDAR